MTTKTSMTPATHALRLPDGDGDGVSLLGPSAATALPAASLPCFPGFAGATLRAWLFGPATLTLDQARRIIKPPVVSHLEERDEGNNGGCRLISAA